jgi:putative aldouronate transport system permease protein
MLNSRLTSLSRLSRLLIHGFFILVSITMVAPMLLVVAISFTDEATLMDQGYTFMPPKIDLTAYRLLFRAPGQLLRAYGVTIGVTVVGTLCSVLLIMLTGYVISRRSFRYRVPLTVMILFSMLFNAGVIPTYILMTRYLHLKNNVLALVLPLLFNPFFVLVVKAFLASIPEEIIDSAKIDGASELRIFIQIILPLSRPILATLIVMISFIYWNDWWRALLYIDDPNLAPLQLMLYRMMNQIQFIANNPELQELLVGVELPTLSLRMAMVVLAAGPIMFVFPFFQNYFVRGLTLGSTKG